MKKVFAIFTALLIFGACYTFTGCEQATNESSGQETVTTEE